MPTSRKRNRKVDPKEPCVKCGRLHERQGHVTCSGHRKAQYGGGPCMKFPVKGTNVCRTHGAAAPQTKVKAAEKVAIEKLRRTVAHLASYDPESVVTPVQEMLHLVRESSSNVAFLGQLVRDLPIYPSPGEWVEGADKPYYRQGDPGIYGPTYHQSGIPTGEAKPHVLVVMYNEERDRHRANLKAAIDAGIEERRLQLLEADAERLFSGVGEAMRAAELTPAQVEAFKRALADSLRRSEPPGLAR